MFEIDEKTYCGIVNETYHGWIDKGKPKCPSCERCGLCCLHGPCQYGEEIIDAPEPGCRFLVRTAREHFACYLVLSRRRNPVKLFIGKGCMLRSSKVLFENLRKTVCYEETVKYVNWDLRYKMLMKELPKLPE